MRLPIALAAALRSPALVAPAAVLGQDATPASTVTCTVEPRSVDELTGLYFKLAGTPLATPTPPPAYASIADLPPGEPVDAATEAAIEGTMVQIISCFDSE